MARGRRAYTPKTTHEHEELIASYYDGPVFDGPVVVDITYDGEGQTVTISEASFDSPLRGDLDNYVKLTLDALQGHAYESDKAVVGIHAEKIGKEL